MQSYEIIQTFTAHKRIIVEPSEFENVERLRVRNIGEKRMCIRRIDGDIRMFGESLSNLVNCIDS